MLLSCDLTYLPRHVGMELAPCPALTEQVVKASSGHIPQPFLISNKELAYRQAGWRKDNGFAYYTPVLLKLFQWNHQ